MTDPLPTPRTPDARARILVVDDEADIAYTIQAVLARFLPNVEVEAVTSPREGIERLGRQTFDLVIADYRMPGLDGIQFLHHARQMQPQARRLLLTAYPEQDLGLQASERADVHAFLTKPVQRTAFIPQIEDLLGRARSAHQVTATAPGRREE